MVRSQVTLYDDDAARFEELREQVGELRPGEEPSNAELVRILMDVVDLEDVAPIGTDSP